MRKYINLIVCVWFLVGATVYAFPPMMGGGGGGGTASIAADALWDVKGDLAVGTGANTGGKLAIGTAYQLLHVNTDTPGWTSTLGATGTRLTKGWLTDLEITNYPTINGATVFNQAVTSTSNPAFSTINVVGANALNLGSSRTIDGEVRFKSGTSLNDFYFKILGANFGANIGWTLPIAAPAGNDYLLRSSTTGVLSYVDPATIGGATQASLHVDDILTALGVASEAVNFGTFTGSTIADNVTAKAALQALETALELKQTAYTTLTSLGGLAATANRLYGRNASNEVALISTITLDDSAAQFYNFSFTDRKVGIDVSGISVAGKTATFKPITARDAIFKFDLDGMLDGSTAKTATLKFIGTGDAIFTNNTVPAGTYKFGLLEVAGTWTAKQTFNDIAIPSGTGPTVDAAGEIAVDTTTDQLAYYGGAKRVLPYIQYASFVIPAPAATDDINILKAPYGMTILGINCIVQGTTSVTGQLQECDSAGANCADLDSDIACDADGAADDGSLTDSAIASGAWLRWNTTSISGTPTFLTVTVRYSVVSD